MRHFFLLVLFSSILYLSVFSQRSYQPMVVAGVTWGETRVFEDDNGISYNVNVIYQIAEDSLVNTLTYKKVYISDGSISISSKTFSIFSKTSRLVALLREDTVNKKVYIIALHNEPNCNINNSEEVLYDFGLGVGDSVRECYDLFLDPGDTISVISETDSLVKNSQFLNVNQYAWGIDSLRVFRLDNENWGLSSKDSFYELIGSAFGPLRQVPAFFNTPPNVSRLRSTENSFYCRDTSICKVNIVTSNRNEGYGAEIVRIFPNPISISKTSELRFRGNKQFTQFALIGSEGIEHVLELHESQGVQSLPIPLDINPGVFILRCFDRHGYSFYHKIMILK